MRIGILALQGDVEEHGCLLEALGVDVREVRLPRDLDGIDGLVLPGGESTTLQLLIDAAGLREPMSECIGSGLPVLGTCAGMILLAKTVLDGRADQWSFGAVDIAVRRNAYGRQVESFEADVVMSGLDGGTLHAVFIRAPVVESVGPGVEVLAEFGGRDGRSTPVVCRQGSVTVAAFHPELVGDPRLHRLFIDDAHRVRR